MKTRDNMGQLNFLLACVTLWCVGVADGKTDSRVRIPRTRFTCQGRPSGYYADIETGCQVYHMCDDLGRQFSYSCPNTTLFQQRMLICDHWYMVNCSMSERDYDANLLIGQRDKPFVSDEDMKLRTPRPDILSVPPNNNYYDGLREAESNFAIHPGNSIVGIADSIYNSDNNDLDSGKHNYRPPTSWSTGIGQQSPKEPTKNFINTDSKISLTSTDSLSGAGLQGFSSTFQPTAVTETQRPISVSPPSRYFVPPFPPVTTTEQGSEDDIDVRGRSDDAVYKFINRFDPNSPDSIKTSMTKTEILNINQQLPDGQISSEEDRTPRKSKNFSNKGSNFNIVENEKKKGFFDDSRFDSVNLKPTGTPISVPTSPSSQGITIPTPTSNQVPVPDRNLLPPKTDFSPLVTTTMGPPIYYEWKWAVPAFDLEPPKQSSPSNNTETPKVKPSGQRPFSVVPRSTPKMATPSPSNTEYNISSYFVPDYVFPLDGPHPGYDDKNAQTSFQVKISRPGRANYGENPACPQCHPAYLNPGSCEPCIVKR